MDEIKLSVTQKRVLKSALPYQTGYGYSPIIRGFARTAHSLIRLGLATGTGMGLFGERDLRGIILTPTGKALAEKLP